MRSKLMMLVVVVLLVCISCVVWADGIQVTGSGTTGDITVDNGKWRYTFRLKDNLLTGLAKSGGGPNLLTKVKGGGGHWIYLTGVGSKNDPKQMYRQGEAVVTASHQILYVDDSKAVIRFITMLEALKIEDVYTFEAQSEFIMQAFKIEAVKRIPNLTLLTWQAKLGTSGKQAEPFDWFFWGKADHCVVRNEDRLSTSGIIQKLGVKVNTRKVTTETYWLEQKSMDENFIAMFSRKRHQFWMLAFPVEDDSPWYFFGDRGARYNYYSTWFGYRVFGDTIYSKQMPTSNIEKGMKWTGSVCHILGIGDERKDLTEIYKNWQMKNNTGGKTK